MFNSFLNVFWTIEKHLCKPILHLKEKPRAKHTLYKHLINLQVFVLPSGGKGFSDCNCASEQPRFVKCFTINIKLYSTIV